MKFEYYELNNSKISIPIAESYKDCFDLIKSDQYRLTGKKMSTLSVVLYPFKPFSRTFLFWFRMSSYKGFLYLFCRIMHMRAREREKVYIPSSTKIGYGLYIGHNICTVVNGRTIIGNNVNLSQFVNVGTNCSTPAIIGDNVYIAPHVCIVEDVKIGNNATIGAGAVVTKDVPENATVVGVPAKVINYKNAGRYIHNRYEV